MTNETTLGMIKPDAVKKKVVGKIISMIEESGIEIEKMKTERLTKEKAQKFYQVHKDKPFYEPLTEFMSSGPIVVMKLSGENVVSRYRKLMGATDFAKAEAGTIRKLFATSIQENAVHGSDSPENAKIEIEFFYSL